ncbi:LysR substrate-binding domain-containing protein [Streptomyces radicis]|uniref:LysR family transcriptional regulator n=1 Tax=Streptomyces radicis TaxID=1750517 RepID=A0A3A9W8I3_9ACTN|nr:LysR substrate-binding domain-containing protein [Streptomyces radicis]RKN09408.1 LysR family transcriptional regulator [Streptomyces radicis]RKN22995.1 LysR family transcriptional regulator [Streptomyces radicis]
MDLRLLGYFVAVAEELHFGRAAVRLHIRQPPLSRAIRKLEADLGTTLFDRTPAGVTLTPAGTVLLDEARSLLAHAERTRDRVAALSGPATLTLGLLGDGDTPATHRVMETFRRRHPRVEIRIRETDLTDPTCGLAAGRVDVALTRGPFDETGLRVTRLTTDPVAALLRADDPLAGHPHLTLADLDERQWFRFPETTDAQWRSYWNAGKPRSGPLVRAVTECRQAVLWNGTVGMTPMDHRPGEGLAMVPLRDMPPSHRVVACAKAETSPYIRSFFALTVAAFRA